MARNRQSAKDAGTRFERSIAEYLASELDDDRIERRARNGSKDRGDISGVQHLANRVVVEVKNTSRINLPAWVAEAHTEAGNDDALVGIVVHKRHGVSDPGKQWVTMTVDDWVAHIDGQRHGHRNDTIG